MRRTLLGLTAAMAARLRPLGAEPGGASADELAKTMRTEDARSGEAVERAGLRPD